MSRRPTIHGDQGRAVTVALPPSYEALHSIVLSSFVMNEPIRFYRNGKALVSSENYHEIEGGDQIVVVDSQGRKVELKDLFQTTYDRDFAPKELPRTSMQAPAEEETFVPMKDDRDFLSTTQREYRPWKIEPRKIVEQEEVKRETIPFTATTTMQDTYRAYKLEPRRVQETEKYERPTIPFTATTTNQDTFKSWPIEKRSAGQESIPEPPPSIPFAATTTNQDTYKAYKIEPRHVEDAVPSIPESLPFTGTTTNADTYRRWSIPKKTYISLVPANDAFISRATGETVGDYLDVVGEDIIEEEEYEEEVEKATAEAQE